MEHNKQPQMKKPLEKRVQQFFDRTVSLMQNPKTNALVYGAIGLAGEHYYPSEDLAALMQDPSTHLLGGIAGAGNYVHQKGMGLSSLINSTNKIATHNALASTAGYYAGRLLPHLINYLG